MGQSRVGDDVDDAEDVDGPRGGEVFAADEGGADGDAGDQVVRGGFVLLELLPCWRGGRVEGEAEEGGYLFGRGEGVGREDGAMG